MEGTAEPSSNERRKQEPLVWLCGALTLLIVAVGFPGHLGADSLLQMQASLEGRTYRWHPPLMVAVWRLCNLLIEGPFLMLLLQAWAWSLGVALVARRAFPERTGVRSAAFLAIGLLPVCFGHLVHISKDAQMMAFLTLAVGLLFHFDEGEPRSAPRRWPVLALPLILVYASGVRYNSLAALPPLVVWMVLLWERGTLRGITTPRKVRNLTLGAALVSLTGAWIAGWALKPDVDDGTPLSQTLIFDILGVSARSGHNYLPLAHDGAALSPEKIDDWYAQGWRPLFRRPEVRAALHPAAAPHVTATWFEAVTQQPLSYAHHRLSAFATSTGFSPPKGAYITLPPQWDSVDFSFPEHGLQTRWSRSWLSQICASALEWAKDGFPGAFRAWRYLLLAGGLGGLCAILTRRRGDRYPRTLLLLASALLYSSSYLVLAGAPNLRFHLWSVAAVVLALPVFLYEFRTSSARKAGQH
ncbi:hypothetical protein MK489_11090 [Myxococcota bacterium]|nr:hypothetical protein [Myxococcota bacterium]